MFEGDDILSSVRSINWFEVKRSEESGVMKFNIIGPFDIFVSIGSHVWTE